MGSVRLLGSGLRDDVEYPVTRSVARDWIASDMVTTAGDWAITDYHPSDLLGIYCRGLALLL